MLLLIIQFFREQVICTIAQKKSYNDKYGMNPSGSQSGQNSNLNFNQNIFVNLYSGTAGAVIRFVTCSGLFCSNKDLSVSNCLFIRCGTNRGNGGSISFDADQVTINRCAVFECEAIKINGFAAGSFGYFKFRSSSTFNQITTVRISPDDPNLHFQNDLYQAKHYAVFYTVNDEILTRDAYSFQKINQTDCYGTYYSPCFECDDGNSNCKITQSIFVGCICKNVNSRGLIYVFDPPGINLNNLYFVDCGFNDLTS
jgi:hypothetical protein